MPYMMTKYTSLIVKVINYWYDVTLAFTCNYRKSIGSHTQVFTNDAGEDVVFQPVTFKFSKPLAYENISRETVENKVILLQVKTTNMYIVTC